MARCPVCESSRIVIVVSPERRAFCTACGARWIQDGSEQRSVRRGALATVTQLPGIVETGAPAV
jgi:hypothetical protein